eukprot:GHVN01001384.1.p1 GENE.GHVN01001384.1~~GHVN01001384.1.p1  ORF type:complete len:184 (+),score=22.57 GHVN01001384.1:43-594(+)
MTKEVNDHGSNGEGGAEDVQEEQYGQSPPVVQPNPTVFFEMGVGGQRLGRLAFELFADICPKTCLNFLELCRGYRPSSGGRELTYKNSLFHRITPHFMLQGGDITHGDGRGGESIYGGYFGDENFILKHHDPGMLSMANNGPNTNKSQFFITTVPCPWLDGKNVVFGKVINDSHSPHTICLSS